jgi:uncharacterized membrane-anchored protein YhcB (DUF1043 family)
MGFCALINLAEQGAAPVIDGTDTLQSSTQVENSRNLGAPVDPVYLIWLFAIGALVGGGIIGAIVYRNMAPSKKKTDDLRAELDEARQEMETYKTSVNSHFDKTAELVNELTQDYVKVYKHLAEGAQSLGDTRDFINVLEQHQGKVLISVDDATTVQDTIVSELSADMREQQETPEDFSALHDEVAIAEKASASGEDADTKVKPTEPAGASADPDENNAAVTDVEESSPNQDDSDVTAKAVAGSGHDTAAESTAVDTEDKKKVVEPA